MAGAQRPRRRRGGLVSGAPAGRPRRPRWRAALQYNTDHRGVPPPRHRLLACRAYVLQQHSIPDGCRFQPRVGRNCCRAAWCCHAAARTGSRSCGPARRVAPRRAGVLEKRPPTVSGSDEVSICCHFPRGDRESLGPGPTARWSIGGVQLPYRPYHTGGVPGSPRVPATFPINPNGLSAAAATATGHPSRAWYSSVFSRHVCMYVAARRPFVCMYVAVGRNM